MQIKLEPITHAYTVDGIPRPSQSALSDLVYGKTFYPETETQAEKRNRGNDFHLTTHLIDNGKKLKSKPIIDRWVSTWEKFKREWLLEDYELRHNEEMFYAPTVGYCTTMDRVYYIEKSKSWAVLDIKTGAKDEVKNKFQLAAGLVALLDTPITPGIISGISQGSDFVGINFFLIGDDDYEITSYPFSVTQLSKYRNLLASAVVIWNERMRAGKLQEVK